MKKYPSPPSRAQLLEELENLPDTALVSVRHAAAALDTSPGVLANWRSQRRGPPYCGHGDFIRYRISELYWWISNRAGEVPSQKIKLLPEEVRI